MKVLDLFCGCGGISEGFRLAGYEVVGGIDVSEEAIATYSLNFPEAISLSCDITKFDDEKIKYVFGKSNIDVIVGGPPCQGFSNANRWQKENDDPRNKLFFEYLRFVKVLSPNVVIIENVRGILSKDSGYAKNRIVALLSRLGYEVSSKVLNAADFGVPQSRYRAFFVGIKKSRNLKIFDFEKMHKKTTVTVGEAISELYKFEKSIKDTHKLKSDPQTEYQRYLRASDNIIRSHKIVYPAKLTQERIGHVPQGGNWRDIPSELFSNQRNNRHSSAYKRLEEKAVSVTIDTGNAHSNYFHPRRNRIPTVREAARIQSFRDEFVFEGSRSNQYKQIGNAVPPLLAFAIADALKDMMLKNENN